MHIVTKERSNETIRRVAMLAAALAENARGYFDPAECAADASVIVEATDECARLRSAGAVASAPVKIIRDMADKHCVDLNRRRGRVVGLVIPNSTHRSYFETPEFCSAPYA